MDTTSKTRNKSLPFVEIVRRVRKIREAHEAKYYDVYNGGENRSRLLPYEASNDAMLKSASSGDKTED